MLARHDYYSLFVLSYLRNALHKFRSCQIAEALPMQPGAVIREDAATSIIFSSMTLEAFANYCLEAFVTERAEAEPTSTEKVRSQFEGLSLAERTKLLFKQRESDFLEKRQREWSEYVDLIKLRNVLVHSTEREPPKHFSSIEKLSSEDAGKALVAVNRMMTYGIRMFAAAIPDGTYRGDTFEPTLRRGFPQEEITLTEILAEPFQVSRLGLRPFKGFGPKQYREPLSMENLIPPDNLPMFEIQPLIFSAASNDGLASIRVVGYSWDENDFIEDP